MSKTTPLIMDVLQWGNGYCDLLLAYCPSNMPANLMEPSAQTIAHSKVATGLPMFKSLV